ncbi:MAG: ABC transporter substrate-binding protein [Deltaproteobacteria bacterium]|nr:ABC transporter substrate-binding protein [Deltaproteobacteria bacterium]
MKKILVLVLGLLLAAPLAFAGTVKIAALIDESGPTGDVGKPYGEGIKDAVQWFNDNGGLNGDKIDLIYEDYAYKVPQAISAYKRFNREKVVAIHGWGTGDTEAMVKFISKDKIPYFSASYSQHLTDPAKAPYNFLVGPTYGDQTTVALKYVKDNGKARTVAFLYNDSGFGRAPFFPHGEDKAKELGVKLVDTEVVGLKDLDATSQLLNMKKANPEFALIQQTYMATSTILKDSAKLGLPTQYIGLNWTFGKKLVELVGKDAEGFMGTSGFAFWDNDEIEGIKFLKELNKKYHPELTFRPVNYVQGFSSMYVLLSGMKMANKNYDGENLKKIYEGMKNFDTMGLTAPVTFTPESHKGVSALKIYKIENGNVKPMTEFISAQ